MAKRRPVGNGPSAPGATVGFAGQARQGGMTRRPNANPEPLEGTYDGSRGQPSNVGGTPKAVYDTERRDSVKYIPTPVAVQEDFVAPGKVESTTVLEIGVERWECMGVALPLRRGSSVTGTSALS